MPMNILSRSCGAGRNSPMAATPIQTGTKNTLGREAVARASAPVVQPSLAAPTKSCQALPSSNLGRALFICSSSGRSCACSAPRCCGRTCAAVAWRSCGVAPRRCARACGAVKANASPVETNANARPADTATRAILATLRLWELPRCVFLDLINHFSPPNSHENTFKPNIVIFITQLWIPKLIPESMLNTTSNFFEPSFLKLQNSFWAAADSKVSKLNRGFGVWSRGWGCGE